MRSDTVLVLLAVGCGAGRGAEPEPPSDDLILEDSLDTEPRAPLVELSAETGVVRVHVELARTQAEKERGLMWRRHLARDAGMLFVYDRMEHRSFWMKDTFIPLDMIFIDDRFEVVGVVEEATPLTDDGREVEGDSQYVLEVSGGFCRRHGIGRGSRARFFGVPGHGDTP